MKSDRPAYDIAVIGGGFAGTQLIRELVRQSPKQLRLAVIDGGPHFPLGPAYATKRPEHLLNVRAADMQADDGDAAKGDFGRWLQSPQAVPHVNTSGYAHASGPDAFAPRMLYGAYLLQRWRETREVAVHGLRIDTYQSMASRIGADGVLYLENGLILRAARIVLALGNRFEPDPAGSRIVRQPWHFPFETLRDSTLPAIVLGTGLTAIDTMLSLETACPGLPVIAVSRRGMLPLPHEASPSPPLSLPPDRFAGATRLSAMLRILREEAMQRPWQQVMDAIRPHIPMLWQRLEARDRRRLLGRYFSLWNVHRHRAPPEVLARLAARQAQGMLSLRRGAVSRIVEDGQRVRIAVDGKELEACAVFDCRGPSPDPCRQPLLSALIVAGLAEAHPTGAGLVTIDGYRLQGASDSLYAMGSLLLGERLETTAVRELRAQAAELAERLLQTMSAH